MYTISHIDTCNSEYFSCHCLPTIQVMVDCNTTYQNIKDSLLDYQTYHYLLEDQRFVTEESADGFNVDNYKEGVEQMFLNIADMQAIPDDLQYCESMENREEYNCYRYFEINSTLIWQML